jgi:hypothetical protein
LNASGYSTGQYSMQVVHPVHFSSIIYLGRVFKVT